MVQPHRFLISPCRNSKGRELRTAVRRRAYSPGGYSISPLPTLNSRNIHHIPRFFYLDRQKKPLFRDWQPLTEEFLGSRNKNAIKTGKCQDYFPNLNQSQAFWKIPLSKIPLTASPKKPNQNKRQYDSPDIKRSTISV